MKIIRILYDHQSGFGNILKGVKIHNKIQQLIIRIWMTLKIHLMFSNKIDRDKRFFVQSIIYLLLANCNSVYLHLFLWILYQFTIYIHEGSILLLTCLHMYDLDHIICCDYKKDRINRVTRIRHLILSTYYGSFRLLLEHDSLVCQLHIDQVYYKNFWFYTILHNNIPNIK